jgi:hypothetical protein
LHPRLPRLSISVAMRETCGFACKSRSTTAAGMCILFAGQARNDKSTFFLGQPFALQQSFRYFNPLVWFHRYHFNQQPPQQIETYPPNAISRKIKPKKISLAHVRSAIRIDHSNKETSIPIQSSAEYRVPWISY